MIHHPPGKTWKGTSFRQKYKPYPCLECSVEGASRLGRKRVEGDSDVLHTGEAKPIPWSALGMEITGWEAQAPALLTLWNEGLLHLPAFKKGRASKDLGSLPTDCSIHGRAPPHQPQWCPPLAPLVPAARPSDLHNEHRLTSCPALRCLHGTIQRFIRSA